MNSVLERALRVAAEALTQFLNDENKRRQERHDHNARHVARSTQQMN